MTIAKYMASGRAPLIVKNPPDSGKVMTLYAGQGCLMFEDDELALGEPLAVLMPGGEYTHDQNSITLIEETLPEVAIYQAACAAFFQKVAASYE